jgi:HPt (histidine-containing phosphotransfer) domain-containing protein
MTDDLAGIWKEFLPIIREQLQAVEDAVRAAVDQKPDDEVFRNGVSAAHKLAGSIGSFGLMEGSRAASEIERSLRASTQVDATQARQLSELVATLRKEVESA